MGGAQRSRAAGIVAVVVVGMLLAACSAASPEPVRSSTPTGDAAGGEGPEADIHRLVDIGGGRKLALDCRGSGSPTVILVSGTGGAADEWMSAVDASDPNAKPALSEKSVFDILSRTTRVCAYDRPGTTLVSGAPVTSTPVPQPTTAQDGAADLAALLAAARQDGPYVLVGASWGGMIAQLFAREHPGQTKGIVLVDSASAFLKDTMTPTQWARWMVVIASSHASATAEEPDYQRSLAELRAAPPMPRIPATVLSSDHAWDLGVTPGTSTWPAWLAAQDRLAASLHATHIGKTDSGHGIAVEQPALVSRAVAAVVAEARSR
ncbi:MAG: alpha/beta fold hydrolase [Humibacter sp.]